MKNILIIFVRNLIPGKVKTRLARKIGNEAAVKVYSQLLKHTFEATKPLKCDKAVYYSESVSEADIWDNSYQKKIQEGKNLGERMHHAFKTAFSDNYEKAVIIGSDMYDLRSTHIEEAFKTLNNNDIAIGPAEDGGYYLLGMKTLHPGIFKKKAWGTATVLQQTLEDIKESKVHLLETLNDIDTYEDMAAIDAFQRFLKPDV